MEKEEVIKYWQKSASGDHQVAKELIKSKHFDWSLFIYHLVIEKLLKACVVRAGKVPPYTHNLAKLAKSANLAVDDNYQLWLDEITDFNLNVRYDDEKESFHKKVTTEFANLWIANSEEIIQWLKKHLKT